MLNFVFCSQLVLNIHVCTCLLLLLIFVCCQTRKYYSLDEKEKRVRDHVCMKAITCTVSVAQTYVRTPCTRIVEPWVREWTRLILMMEKANLFHFFKLGFTPCKAEQSLRGMELHQKKVQED